MDELEEKLKRFVVLQEGIADIAEGLHKLEEVAKELREEYRSEVTGKTREDKTL